MWRLDKQSLTVLHSSSVHALHAHVPLLQDLEAAVHLSWWWRALDRLCMRTSSTVLA